MTALFSGRGSGRALRWLCALAVASSLTACATDAASSEPLGYNASAPVRASLDPSVTVAAAVPEAISVPAAGIDVGVAPMDRTECPVLDPPTSGVAYWVGCRSKAGTDSDGTVFIIGHSIAGGDAVFNNLARVRPGDRIVLTTSRGVLTYQISETALYSKYGQAQLEPRLRERKPGRLVVVTCFLGADGKTLTDQNFVVYATLVQAAEKP